MFTMLSLCYVSFFPWSDLKKKQCAKPLGPSLGVNRMWTKWNYDHAPKSECVDFFFNICPKRAVLRQIFKFDHSLVFSCRHLLFSKRNQSIYYYYNIILCHGPFSIRPLILPRPPQNMLYHISR